MPAEVLNLRGTCSWLTTSGGCVLLAITSGCGQRQATVSGDVSLAGTPVNQGTVAFNPVLSGPIAYGHIRRDGTYEIRTGNRAGLPSGRYVVTVVSNERSLTTGEAGEPPVPGEPITPAKYRSSERSPLEYFVKEGHNRIDLKLQP